MSINLKHLAAVAAFALAGLAGTTQAASRGGNPQEQVGVDHNLYLDCLMRSGPGAAEAPLQALVERCRFDAGMSGEELQARYGFMVDAHVGVGVVEGAAPYRDQFSDYEFSFVIRMDAALALDVSEAETDALLARLEREAIAGLDHDSRSGQSLLAALSTARHSLRFWAAEHGVGGGGSGTPQRARFPWNIVGADLLGALGGTLIGGPGMGTAIGVACSMAAGK